MFNCSSCHKTTNPGEPATRVITKKRFKEYPKREDIFSKMVDGRKILVDDPGGVGFEPESEALICRSCEALQKNAQPA